jgi:iron complex outermembrane receptor protein
MPPLQVACSHATIRRSWPRIAALALLCGGGGIAGDAIAGAPTAPVTPQASAAQLADLPLEELLDVRVSAASRFEQDAREAPSAVHVITAEEIRAFGWRTLADALGSLPGLFSSYDRSYTYLGARGFLRPGDYGSRFLLLVDGYRLNEPIYEQATAGYEFPIAMDLVERIEYVPGPGSSVFGSNAFFGIINVITRSGAEAGGGRVAVEAGSAGHRGVSARYGLSGSEGELLIAASGIDADGDDLYFPEFEEPGQDGVAHGLDHERTRKLFLKAEHGALGVSLIHSSREKGTPTAAYLQRFGDPRSSERDDWSLLGLRYRGKPSASLETEAHALFGAYDYYGDFAYDVPPDGLNRDVAHARWIGFGAHAVSTAFAGHKLLVGIDAQWDARRDQYNYDDAPRVHYLADERDAVRAGIMVEDEIALRKGLLVNAGLRFDHDSISGGNLSPRVALIKHWSADSTLKLIHGSAFRSPNAYELYYHAGDGEDSSSQIANPNLQPERIRASELVWSQRLSARTQWQASLYRYQIKELIAQVGAGDDDASAMDVPFVEGPLVFRNVDRADATGLELSGEHRWTGGAALRASYGYAHVEATGAGVPVNSPRHVASLNLRVPFADERLLAGFEARYVGERHAELGPVGAYALANLTLTWRTPVPGLELQGSVRNLFDERYADPAGPSFLQNAIEQDGRTVLLRASFGF